MECKVIHLKILRNYSLRLIGNIVECKDGDQGHKDKLMEGLIGNIVECKESARKVYDIIRV